MVEAYIKLRKEIYQKEGLLKEQILKGKSDLERLEKTISECQNSLEKGNGFSQLLLSKYTEDYEEQKRSTLQTICKMKSELEKSRKGFEKLVGKNKKLQIFENYSQVIPTEEFKKSLVDLIEGHRNGAISNEILEKAKTASLKFKEIELEGKKYHVKDNRKNYADMIIFNQSNQILFVKRNKDDEFQAGKYALPGGHVEPAEDPKLAAIREVEEELYLTLDKRTVVPVGVYEDTDVVISYFCTKIDGTGLSLVLEERELQQYEWVDMDKIGELDLILNLKSNFENVIDIPVTILENAVGSKEIAAFYGIPGDITSGTGYAI